jgi:acyl carrier protein
MMPSAFMAVAAMPVTDNGKLDAGALPSPRFGSSAASEIGADGILTARIAEIWRRVLGAEFVSYDDQFFDIGGNSRLLVALHKELEEAIGRRIPVTDLFAYTTVRKLAAHLKSGATAEQQQEKRQANAMRQRSAFTRSRAERK